MKYIYNGTARTHLEWKAREAALANMNRMWSRPLPNVVPVLELADDERNPDGTRKFPMRLVK